MGKDIKLILIAIIILLTILTVTGVGYFLVAQKALKDHAVTECFKISSVSSFSGDQNNSHRFNEPILDWYKMCMQEKGYE